MAPVLSHPNLKDGVEARAYQLIAAKEALSCSTLLVMPTGLGKTAVQWMAMAHYLNGDGRIVLVAPTTGLVDQQARMARNMININPDRIVVLTGQQRPPKRQEIWKNAKIVIATPHVIRNDARDGRILLSEVDLLIFDEAHHATGSDSMAVLGDLYLESNSQGMVLAATASPGVRDDKILEIIQRLGIEKLHVTKRDDDLVSPYATSMDIEYHHLELNALLKSIIEPLINLEDEEAEFLRRSGFLPGSGIITTAAIEEAHKRASAAIGKGNVRGYDAAKRIADLRRLHRLIDLVSTQGLVCAIKYLQRALNDKDRKTKRFLSLSPVIDLYRNYKDNKEIHPKPGTLSNLTKKVISSRGKVIIFTEYRDTVDMIVDMLSTISNVKPGKFVGQSSKGKQIGMKQKEQLEQLDNFRSGQINVLVATSVGEEGLDVPAADCVILYEPVPSAIRAIQRRGRTARRGDGDVHVLIAKDTRDEFVQHASARRETAMYRALERLKKQSRLPRRSPSSKEILSSFMVDSKNAGDFILTEIERLYVEIETEGTTANQNYKITETGKDLPTRSKNQRTLIDFD
ncbi:MAG: helicase-related protein [Candidatus Poseidoniaceae archaeon]|nr:helicase-related protein [Candidatus Poseidoniaceae archaeon]